jgi:hypothetical protein
MILQNPFKKKKKKILEWIQVLFADYCNNNIYGQSQSLNKNLLDFR